MKNVEKKLRRRVASSMIVASLAVASLTATNAIAAVDMFLKLDGIAGESTDAKHANEIDVLAWSWGASEQARSQRSTGQPFCPQALSLTKYIDRATPVLLTKAATGDSIANAKLTVRKAGANPVDYVVMTFTGVRIASISTGGSGGEDRLTEVVAFNFSSATVTYTPQKADGSADSPVTSTVGASCS